MSSSVDICPSSEEGTSCFFPEENISLSVSTERAAVPTTAENNSDFPTNVRLSTIVNISRKDIWDRYSMP